MKEEGGARVFILEIFGFLGVVDELPLDARLAIHPIYFLFVNNRGCESRPRVR